MNDEFRGEVLRDDTTSAELRAENIALARRVRELEAQQRLTSRKLHVLETALSHTPDFTYTFDLAGRFTFINQGLLSLWHRTLEDSVGRNFFELDYPVDLAAKLQRQIDEVIASGETVRDETPYVGADGLTRHYEYIFVPVLTAEGAVQAVVGSTRDVTNRRQVEDDLRASEERFSITFLNAPVGIVVTTPDGVFLDANPAYMKMLGYSRDELLHNSSRSFTHPDDISRTDDYGEQFRVGVVETSVLEKRYIRKDGQTMVARATGNMRRDEQGNPVQFVAVIEDITERKRIEQALLESEKRLSEIFSQAPVAIIVFRGRDFIVELANPLYKAVLAGREITGRPFRDVMPELGQEVWDIFNQVMNTGEPFVASEWLVPYDKDGDGVPEDHWFNVVYHPLRDGDASVSGFIAVLTDVTQQVIDRKELERVNQALEEFAYAASHDLQEPLRMVSIYSELLLKRHAVNAEAELFAGFIRQGVRRMETLISDLLNYARVVQKDDVPPGVADLNTAFRDAAGMLNARIQDSGARISVPPLPLVRGETAQLSLVFQNLLTNALKYRRPEVACEIAVSAFPKEGGWIVSVRDNGIGFEPQYAEQIFGLFKRLHTSQYPGTGLGLAICQRIVQRYGGRMWAESSPGEGAAFFFFLPNA